MYIRNRGDGRELSASSKVCPHHLPPSHPWSLLRGWRDLVATAHTVNYSWCDPKGPELLPENCSARKSSARQLGTGNAGGLGMLLLGKNGDLGCLMPQSR